jgi:hypothetical protein
MGLGYEPTGCGLGERAFRLSITETVFLLEQLPGKALELLQSSEVERRAHFH